MLVSVADKDPLILDFRNGRVLDGAGLDEYDLSGLDDEPANWDDIDLEDAFDLPPVLTPVRLPEEAELAAQARRLLPSEEVEEVGDATLKLKNGRAAHVTMHLLEGSKEEIEKQLKTSLQAFFDFYPEI